MHDRQFALSSTRGNTESKTPQCCQCLAPFQVLDELRAACDAESPNGISDDVSAVFDNAEDMVLKFYGHQHRVGNQKDRISELLESLKHNLHDAVVLMDYKMKFESIRFREKTSEFFGKRGCSWHGAVVFFAEREGVLNQLYYDQISNDDTMQDTFAVATMCDVICRRISVDLPQVRFLHFLSDNARCYQNLSLPVMLPFIVRSHGGLSLKTFLHSETQDGKSLIDAHFAVAMMHINRFVADYGENVITPRQVVSALNCNEGMANTVAEIVSVNRNSDGIRNWEKCVSQKTLAKFGRINEFMYRRKENETYAVRAFQLSGFDYKELIFSRTGSRFAAEYSEEEVTETERENCVDAGEGYDDGDDTEELDTDLQQNGGIEAESDGDRMVLGETGAIIRTNASIRRVQKRVLRRREEVDLQNCGVRSEESDEEFRVLGTPSICNYCGHAAESEEHLKAHKETCCTKRAVQLQVQGATIAKRLITSGLTRVHWDTKDSPALAPFAARVTEELRNRCKRSQGWACRPAYGTSFGRNTTQKYAQELLEFYKKGAEDKRRKIGAPEMIERLQSKHPRRYDIPSEIHVIQFISGLHVKWKKLRDQGKGLEELTLTCVAKKGRRMAEKYSCALKCIVEEKKGGIMPREGYDALLAKLGVSSENLPDDFPNKKQVSSKISALKRAYGLGILS